MFMDKMGEGGSVTIFHRKTFVSECRRTSWGTILYFRESQHQKNMNKGGIIILPKLFMDKIVRGRESHNFPSKNCCLKYQKTS